MTAVTRLREKLCACGHSLFARGLTFGTSGNLSVRLPDGGWLMTPTNISLGDLDPARLSHLDENGRVVSGDAPTKEAFLHLSMYRKRPQCEAVVHLHSTHAVAVSCLCGLDASDCLPPLTAYYVMRIGRLPLIRYFPPGDQALAQEVEAMASTHHAVLLANHGPVVSGTSLDAAMSATEELEETAKLFLLLRGEKTSPLTTAQVEELRQRFPS
ncbi:MAG: aldolase [Hyphomicrobiales bacterium]|jgi:ribulose-5-phosphate 4-epimerase/fuculose-1-phosphate aldolase|nr:aldolase [Hyphomicrobiales bacterium]